MQARRNDKPWVTQGSRLIIEDGRCWHVDETTKEGLWLSDGSSAWLMEWGDYYQLEVTVLLPPPRQIGEPIRVDLVLQELLKRRVKSDTDKTPEPELMTKRLERIRRRVDKAARCVK